MKIYFIRHGETNSNKAHRLMGQRIDEPLNEEGRKQALALKDTITHIDYDLIFSSPLKRALETAQAITKDGSIEILIRDDLKERDFGSLSGKSWAEMDAELGLEPGTMRQRDFDQTYDYSPFEGETGEDVKNRLFAFIDEIKKNFSDKKIIVVAHGGILRSAQLFLAEKAIGHIDNTEVAEFEI